MTTMLSFESLKLNLGEVSIGSNPLEPLKVRQRESKGLILGEPRGDFLFDFILEEVLVYS